MHFAEDDLKWLESHGAKVGESIPENIQALVRSCVTQPALLLDEVECFMDRNIIAPVPDLDVVFLVGGVLDHEDFTLEGKRLCDWVSEAIPPNSGPFFFVPAIRNATGCVETEEFSYEVFFHIYTGNLTLPMGVCSPNGGWCLAWDEDLEYSFLVRSKTSAAMPDIFARRDPFWTLFRAAYPEFIAKGQRHITLLNRHVFSEEQRLSG